MSLEDAMMGGIVFKGKKDGPKKEEDKVKTKAKKTTYIKGTHGSVDFGELTGDNGQLTVDN